MESKVPLLSDQKFAKPMKLIDEIRADRAAGKTARADTKMVRLYSANRKPSTDPVVMSGLLRLAYTYYPDRFTDIVDSMIESASEYPQGSLMSAIEILLDGGELDTAQVLFAKLEGVENLSRHAYINGRICQLKGDAEGAKVHYMESFRADPYFLPLYEGLASVDPGYGWPYVAEIMSMKLGLDPTPVRGEECPLQELSAIYSGWIRGDRSNALTAMLASQSYNSDDPFYKMVHAWMCVSDGRYRKAVLSYIEAIRGFGGNVALLTEMADIQDRMGESSDSEIACRRALDLDPFSDAATAQMAISLIHQGRTREAMSVIEGMLKLPVVDARQCARCIDVLWNTGHAADANSLFRKTSVRCSDEAYSNYLTAINSNRNGSYAAAKRAAEAGIKQDPDSVPCICQLAIALAGMGKVGKALEELESNLPVFMDDPRLLDAKKDILISSKRYSDAIEVCDKMLDTDPRNADVMRDKANAYRLNEDYEMAVSCYRESLNIREDLRLFISVLTMLLESRRTDDLCRLVDDYDDTYGSSAIVWRLRGNAEYLAERYEDAVISFSKASAIVGNDLAIWHSRGMAEEKAGLYADAEASYDRAVILDLENEDCWISKATVQELQGNITGAIDSLNRVISVSSDNPYALAMKGRLLARLGKLREAKYFLKLAYALDTTNIPVLEMILRILVREGEIDEAISVGRKVLERDRQSYRTMIVLAEIYAGSDRREEALRMLNDAIPYLSEDPQSAVRVARAYHGLMCYKEEIEIYESLLAQSPDDRDLLMSLAEAYSAAGDRDDAADVYARLETMSPGDASIAVRRVMVSADGPTSEVPEDEQSLMDLAKSLIDGGRMTEGIDILRKIVESCPEDPEQYLYAAYVMAGEGLFDESMAVMKKARGLFPSDARILYSLGTLKEKHGDSVGALSAYNDAARLGMCSHDLFLSMGKLRLGLGMLAPAIDALEDALKEDPSDQEARMLLAEALLRAGREADAVTHLRTVINSDPHNIRALRLYVTAVQSTGGTEGVLSVYDNILSAERTEEDTEFFRQVLTRIGEYTKAEALGGAPAEEPFDAEAAALDVLDTAYAEDMDITEPLLYEGMGMDSEAKDKVLDILTMHEDYEPAFGTRAFEEMERMSNETIVSENLDLKEPDITVPLVKIRHATACASVDKMLRLQRHIELAFSVMEINDICRDEVEYIVERIGGEEVTLLGIMEKYGIGIMTARMVQIGLELNSDSCPPSDTPS